MKKTFLYSLARQDSSTVTVIVAVVALQATPNNAVVSVHVGAGSLAVTLAATVAATKSFIFQKIFFFKLKKLKIFNFDEDIDFDFAFMVEIFWRQRAKSRSWAYLEIILMKIISLKDFLHESRIFSFLQFF